MGPSGAIWEPASGRGAIANASLTALLSRKAFWAPSQSTNYGSWPWNHV